MFEKMEWRSVWYFTWWYLRISDSNYVFFLEDEYLIFLGEFEFLFMLLVSIYIALFLQIIIHEAGHLIFGLMSGYRFCSFRVFSFIWMKENGKIKLKRLSLVGTAGQCLMAPPDLVNGKIPIVLYHLGGVTMNLISAVIFWTAGICWSTLAQEIRKPPPALKVS